MLPVKILTTSAKLLTVPPNGPPATPVVPGVIDESPKEQPTPAQGTSFWYASFARRPGLPRKQDIRSAQLCDSELVRLLEKCDLPLPLRHVVVCVLPVCVLPTLGFRPPRSRPPYGSPRQRKAGTGHSSGPRMGSTIVVLYFRLSRASGVEIGSRPYSNVTIALSDGVTEPPSSSSTVPVTVSVCGDVLILALNEQV